MLSLSGPAGMAALKELRELGFNVTLFERRNDVGGIWTWTEDRSMTTALKETQLCNSKYGVRGASAIRYWRVRYTNTQRQVGLERFPNISRWVYYFSQFEARECDDKDNCQLQNIGCILTD
jgi:cation diffusion facilitator CzcD-associated flavoprotein CzcO